MTKIKLGENVRVSDPCYSNDVWCKTKLTNVLAGMYDVEVFYSQDESFGKRISELRVTHQDYTGEGTWIAHSDIGVDSGQAGIFCESSYRNDDIVSGIVTPEVDFVLPYNDSSGDIWYEKVCKFTLSNEGWGAYETGAVSSSGFGDGTYPLDVAIHDDKIVAIRITYIDDSIGELCCEECGGELEFDGSCVHCEE